MATDPELLVKLDQVIGVKYLTAKEERDWWAGTSTGGPNLDGYYPRTDAAGNTTLRPSPAKIEDLLLLGGGTQYVYPDEFDALAGSGSAHDDAPCLNAMFVKAAQDGRVASLRAGKTYYPRDTVICDPTNTSFDGGGNIIDWRMKTFTPVSTQPNIMTGGSFDSGSGWLYSSQTTIQPTFTGGKVSFNGATGTKFVGSISGTTLTVSSVSSGVLTAGPAFYKDDILSSEVIISPTKIVKQLTGTTGGAGTYQVDTAQTVNSVSMSQNQFLEMGRKIVAKTGDTIRVTAKVARLTSTTVGINTYRTVLIGFRKDTGSANGSLVGGGVSGATKTISNSDSTYVAGVGGTFSWDVVLQSDNPYIRIQSNASFEIDDIDIRVVPNNKCLLFRASPETGVVGVNGKRFGHVMLRGTQSTDDLTIRAVDGMTFDTPQATYSTQAALYDIRCTTGIGRAVVMQNRAYLMRFFACRLIGRECALDTLPGSEDAGENISFVACQMGSGQGGPGTGPAVRNPGGFGLHFFGCSFDFPAQWYKGRGSVEFHGCWLEKNMIVSAAVFSIDVEAGHVQMYGGRIQFDGWDGSSPADTPFRVADGATLSLTGVDVSGARSLTECWVTGIGNFRTSNLRGLSNSPYLISRDDSHNLLGSGGHFQGATITPNIWVNSPGGTSQSANIQPDRRHVLWQTTGTFTAAAVVATKNLSASSTPLSPPSITPRIRSAASRPTPSRSARTPPRRAPSPSPIPARRWEVAALSSAPLWRGRGHSHCDFTSSVSGTPGLSPRT
jgi:hypothetical protein